MYKHTEVVRAVLGHSILESVLPLISVRVCVGQIHSSPKSFKLPLHLKLCSFKGFQIGLPGLFGFGIFTTALSSYNFLSLYTHRHTHYKCSPFTRQANLTRAHTVADTHSHSAHSDTHTQSYTEPDFSEQLIPLNNLGQ